MNDEMDRIAQMVQCPDCNSHVEIIDKGDSWDVSVAHDRTCIHVPDALREVQQ